MEQKPDPRPLRETSWTRALGLATAFESVRFLAEAGQLALCLRDPSAAVIAEGLVLLQPGDPAARLLAADAAFALGRFAEALNAYRAVQLLQSVRGRAFTGALAAEGDCLWRLGRSAEARAAWQRAIASDPARGAEVLAAEDRLRQADLSEAVARRDGAERGGP